MKAAINNSDHLGIIATGLCIIHCLLTPVLFLYQVTIISNEITFLWLSLNYFFLLISLLAVYRSIKNSTNSFVKISLFSAWFLLCFLILNEGIEIFNISEFYTYSSAISLCCLHIYNLKFCRCKDDKCCIHEN